MTDGVGVIAWAFLRGSWAAFEAETEARLVCEGALSAGAITVAAEMVDRSVIEFRRRHRLLAASELTMWLTERGLTTSDLVAFHRREIARVTNDVSEVHGRFFVNREALLAVLPQDLVLSGSLEAWSTEFAVRVAALAALEPAVSAVEPGWAQLVADLGVPADEAGAAWARALNADAAYDAVRAAAMTREALEAEVEARALDWGRLQVRVVRLRSASVAAETLMCVRADGMSLPEAAEIAGAEHHLLDTVAGQLPHALRRAAFSSPIGTVVGPVLDGEAHVLLEVLDKRTASVDDPMVHQLAVDAAETRIRERALQRVVWLTNH